MFDFLIGFPKRLYLWFRSADFGLNLKLIVLIAIVSLVGVLASSVLILTLQRQQLEQGALQSTTRLSDAINCSLEQAMLRNDRQMMQEIIRTMVDKQSVEHIQILDATGTVHIGSNASQVGRRFDYSEPTCQYCHLGDARPGKQSAIVETADDHSALFSVNLIYNQPQCQSCHLPQERILGLTVIEVPLDDLNNQVASGFWRIVFSAVIMFCLLIVLMTLAFRQLIIQPIDKLTQGMMQIRDGNLNYELEHPSRDEFGKLASAFDTMRRQLAAAQTENASLNRRMRSLGILEERDRLARELHDNLAQMLGYINLRAALTDDLLAQNQVTPARESLGELKRIGKEMYTDVREAIFNLRIAMSSQTGLVPLLQDYLLEYREQTGINARLLIEDERLARFPGDVEVQLNRVIQEALTNVRKHSDAKQAWIRFRHENNHIQITIEDNGKGFDPLHLKNNGAQHFGLAIMRERAESVGGEFQIASQPGLGTKIMLQVPRMPLIEDPNENTANFAG